VKDREIKFWVSLPERIQLSRVSAHAKRLDLFILLDLYWPSKITENFEFEDVD